MTNPQDIHRIAIIQDRDGREYEIAEGPYVRVGQSTVALVWNRLQNGLELVARRNAISEYPYRMFIFNPDAIAHVREAHS